MLVEICEGFKEVTGDGYDHVSILKTIIMYAVLKTEEKIKTNSKRPQEVLNIRAELPQAHP